MTTWIKWTKGLVRRREVAVIAASIGRDPHEVAGRLMCLWEWLDDNTNESNVDVLDVSVLLPDNSRTILDNIVGADGMIEAMASQAVGWIRFEDGGRVVFPRFARHNGTTAKTRLLDSERKRISRSGQKECPENVRDMSGLKPDKSVTRVEKSRVDKRREDSSSSASSQNSKTTTTAKCAQDPVRSATGEPVTWAEVAEGMKKLKVARIQDSIAAAQSNDFAPPVVLSLIEHLQALPAGLAESPAGALVDRLRTDGAAEWLVDENWPWSAGKSETNAAAPEPYPIGKSSLPTADEERARNQASLRELDRLIQQHGDTLTAMSTEDLEEMILRSSLGTEKSREMILGLVRSKGRDSPIVHRNLLEMLDVAGKS